MRLRWAGLTLVAALLAPASLLTPSANAAPKAFTTDAEATVYVAGDFRRDFDLLYDARMQRMPANTSWSVVNVTLLGGPPPSDAVAIGLFPAAQEIHVFTSATRGSRTAFRDTGISCPHSCRIGLRGTAAALLASVNGRVIASWPRFALRAPSPAVQLNAEVSAVGDPLDATLTPVRLTAGGRALARPSCAFTTRGVEVRSSSVGSLHYSGTYREDARTAYLTLASPLQARASCGAS